MNDIFPMGNAKHNMLGIEEPKNKYEIDVCKYDLSNKNDSHVLIVDKVIENSKVLDIGCASGLIGNLLKKYKNCRVDGIELDKEAIKKAIKTNSYDQIYNFSITETNRKLYKDFMNNTSKYDYILFADVLEHLVNPSEVIYNFSKKLKPNGKILLSIPNITHIDVIRGVLNNTFNYNSIGILDSTHLRFFTSISFFEMMENYNEKYDRYLSVNYFGKTTFDPNYFTNKNLFKDKNYSIIQNLFELTLEDKKENIKYIKKPKLINNFDIIVKEYNDLKESNKHFNIQLEALLKEIESLKNEKKNIEKKLENLENTKKSIELELQNVKQENLNILNSKRYKFISSFADVKNRIRKDRG